MELITALAPPVAALIALIAVFVNLHNTRRQIRANSENLQKQLEAQFLHLKRVERREILTRAAELVSKQQRNMIDLSKRYLEELDVTLRQGREEFTKALAMDMNRVTLTALDAHYVAATLETIDLPEDAQSMRDYHTKAERLSQMRRELTKEEIFNLVDSAHKLLADFASRLRA